jgi:hypothetical protein
LAIGRPAICWPGVVASGEAGLLCRRSGDADQLKGDGEVRPFALYLGKHDEAGAKRGPSVVVDRLDRRSGRHPGGGLTRDEVELFLEVDVRPEDVGHRLRGGGQFGVGGRQ